MSAAARDFLDALDVSARRIPATLDGQAALHRRVIAARLGHPGFPPTSFAAELRDAHGRLDAHAPIATAISSLAETP